MILCGTKHLGHGADTPIPMNAQMNDIPPTRGRYDLECFICKALHLIVAKEKAILAEDLNSPPKRIVSVAPVLTIRPDGLTICDDVSSLSIPYERENCDGVIR